MSLGPYLRNLARAAVALLAPGCGSATADDQAKVYFELDAPLCSSILPVEFRIDGQVVGLDTFRVHLPPDHIRSRGYPVTAGEHDLGASVIGGFVWADSQVTVGPGQSATRILAFYCS